MKRKIGILAITLTALEAADSFLTMWAVNHGYTELNILVAPFAHTLWMAAVKILPAALVGWLAWWLVGRFPSTWIVAPMALVFGLATGSLFLIIVIVDNLLQML